ncbi:DNA-protecting protein DprA [Chitinophaga agrisoli]|uniref:DNA-protecting protein DprA n=1 Tax=Chitinophaga agrisoli TaxID=2607653 RepID=A0A5B2VNB1_9BACT|nr:DNA-processing protein DprA [Chitinophaga agrisoli]KAA2240525.1 DNA-protecting protein DprA [Chitinophaga agrisoli]
MFVPNELFHQIALTQISQVGDVTAKKLIDHLGSASAVFKAKQQTLERIPEIGTVRAAAIKRFKGFKRIEEELCFIERYKIQPVFYTDTAYPRRLRDCYDSPLLLYFKGTADLNATHFVNIIGTRNPSRYGREICERLVAELAAHNITIVSGLAYGIDILAHKAALQQELPTIGVLAHGLDRIYPAVHKHTAAAMLENGGLLTDFISQTNPDKQNFPKRNRIVAGMCDATIVIETGLYGGSLITADIANSYNRDVFAIPGRIGDDTSAGCHHLIKTHRAQLVTNAADILELMGWQPVKKPAAVQQRALFVSLSQEEQLVMAAFHEQPEQHIDDIARSCRLPGSLLNNVLMQLEIHCMVKSMPGQKYQYMG